MRVTLLGTGASAGVPMIGGADGHGDWGACDPTERRNRRTRASILVQRDGETEGALLVDTGPDLREQMLACGITRVASVIYTHAHADHITGLDDLRLLNRLIDRPIDAFATAATLSEIERRFDYAFRPWTPPGFFRPVLVPRPVSPGETIQAAGLSVRLFDQDHGFVHSLGLRIGGFGYSTDVVTLDEAALAALRGVDTWVVDCFQPAIHRTHAWLGRVLEWVALLRPRRTVLTHMGVEMDWASLVAGLPGGIEPGHDGLVLSVPD
jgi:phosphoribosyl 1,2-cyclic phosphate phosphodiesterase